MRLTKLKYLILINYNRDFNDKNNTNPFLRDLIPFDPSLKHLNCKHKENIVYNKIFLHIEVELSTSH